MSGYLNTNLLNYVKGVMGKTMSSVFIIDGRSGLGKTTLSSQIGCFLASEVARWKTKKYKKHFEPEFSLDNMTWTPDVFIEKLKHAKEGEVIILDESMILSNRATMSEINKAVVIMMSLIRSKKLFIIFNANSMFDLDRNLPLHRADMLVHVYSIDDKFASRGRYFVVPTSQGKLKKLFILGKKFYDYSFARPAFRDHFSSYFPFDDKEYEKRKQAAIETYFQDSGVSSSSRAIQQRDKAFVFLRELEQDVKSISKKCDIGERRIYEILKKQKENELKLKELKPHLR